MARLVLRSFASPLGPHSSCDPDSPAFTPSIPASTMVAASDISGLLKNLPPVMFLVCKYQHYKRNQQQSSIRKVTERELLRLNHKIVSPLSTKEHVFPCGI